MKVFNSILLLLGLLITIPATSQNKTTIETLLERLNENYMGAVTDVFTLEELQQIKAYFASKIEDAPLLENASILLNRRLASTQAVIPVRPRLDRTK